MTDAIALRGVTKTFTVDGAALTVLEDLSLEIPRDGITVLLGKSGCGKTTLLRIAARLDRDFTGEIQYPDRGRIAVVFQEPRLMPWLTVRKNITFALPRGGDHDQRIDALIALTGLESFENARPAQLSGGMEQRCALARALATEPDFLFMDEPFAALDHFTRAAMQQSLLEIHREKDCGVLFITHSIDEALVLADRIVVLRERKIQKIFALSEKPDPASPETTALKDAILKEIEAKGEEST